LSVYLKNFLRCCILILVQALLLNKVTLRWWSQPGGFPVFVPLLYPLALLLLPFNTPVVAAMSVGFLLGLAVDSFTDTGGMHAAACVLTAYLRPNVLATLLPRHVSEYGEQDPSVKNMGWAPFFTYAAFLLLVHHALFFVLEVWSLRAPGYLALKIFASAVTSLLLVGVYALLFTRGARLRE
jgi:hypothetical protein